MKRLRGTIQAMGHRIVHLVDPEHVGLLRFQETGESLKGMDFAVLWNGAWRDGVVSPRFPRAPLFLICSKVNAQWVRWPCQRSVSFRYSPRGCHLCSGGTSVSFRYALAPKRYAHCSHKET
jgi:hypothetical protein